MEQNIDQLPELVHKFVEIFRDTCVIQMNIQEVNGNDETYYFGQYDKESEKDVVVSILLENPNTNFTVTASDHSNVVGHLAKLTIVYLEQNVAKLLVTFDMEYQKDGAEKYFKLLGNNVTLYKGKCLAIFDWGTLFKILS